MCGIAGIFRLYDQYDVDREVLEEMNQRQYHRGPDEGGIHCEPGIGLAHRRLSIIDLSSGQQPLFNEDNSVVIVYNGEIYNFKELARELKEHGHHFRTHSDTEVIVHAWEEWGADCVTRFRGMFAFAVWDRNRQELFLARDRLGIKPLYYCWTDTGELYFSSELKSILANRHIRRVLDQQAVDDYFTLGYIPEPRTIFQDVFKLEPGHLLLAKKGDKRAEPKQYWDIPFTPVTISNEQEAIEGLIERLRDAVKIRMVAEVPLGAFLSGGIDSSSVVSIMSAMDEQPINTCSIGFGESSYDESHYARMVADQYGTRHYEEMVDPNDFSLLDSLGAVYDEPFADSSALPTFRVCELARKHVTVALSGDGGDENLAGYRRHKWHMKEERLRRAFPTGLRKPLFSLLGSIYPKMDWAPRYIRARSTFQALSRDSIDAYMYSVSRMNGEMRNKLFSESFKKDLQGYTPAEIFHKHAGNCPSEHPLSMIQYLDLKTWLSGDILTKVDRASMANSLEVRVPLLDHHLVEWISGLDPALKLHGGNGKYIFKRAFEPYLPNDVLYRRKMGFSVPLEKWFRGPLAERVQRDLSSERLADTGLFNMQYLKQLVEQHQSGMREHSTIIWSILMFKSFLECTVDGR